MALTLPCYVTRQKLAASLDVTPAAVGASSLDQACHVGSRAVETLCRRVFYPTLETRTFDWPPEEPGAPGYRLWLGPDEILSVTSATAAGVALTTADLLLEPATLGPPYDRIDVNIGTSTVWASDETWQRAISITGLWSGAPDDRETVGALNEALDASETAVDVTTATAAAVGVGDLLTIGSERMLVTGWSWATTGETASLTAVSSDQSVTVASIAAYSDEELLLLGGERIRVRDRSGTTLTVDRAVDGTTLAAHTTATLFAARTLTVVRGVLGSTAATHDTAATIQRQAWPALVEQLALAEAQVEWLQKRGGRARVQGGGSGAQKAPTGSIEDVRAQCAAEHRRIRQGAV